MHSDTQKTISLADLKQYRFLQRRIAILRELVKAQEASIAYNASRRTRMNGDERDDKTRATSRVDRLNEIQRILEGYVEESIDKSDEILSFIQSQKDPDAGILYCRYVLGLSWRAVSSRVHLSVDRCQHIHSDFFKRQK